MNPGQNRSTVVFEIHGRSGDSTTDDYDQERFVDSGSLAPGQTKSLSCEEWYSLDMKWHLNTSDYDSSVDNFYAQLVCYGSNPIWNQNNGVREYDFRRQ